MYILAEQAHTRGLELICRIDEMVPAAVRGDPVRPSQILINLIGNAIKFTTQGEVVVCITPIDTTEETTLLRFEVHDTGIGIAPEAQTRIFEVFTQADGFTTRKYGGTGLGLAIAKRLTEMMGGAIGVQSLAEHGATFWFTARLARQPAPSRTAMRPHPCLRGLRVLIVDDNATNRELLHHQVGAWGLHDGCAADGPQALEMLRAAAAAGVPYNLAILDMHMPDMDGVALVRAIKADPAIAAVRLLMLTSVGLYGDTDAARQAGIEQYLSKPVRQSQLYNCLLAVLEIPVEAPITADRNQPGSAVGQMTYHGHVLLVEDNPVNQDVALEMLTYLGCQVDIADNGRDAIKALDRTAYDLVLMDCQMPDMDGFEATRLIREREVSADLEHIIIALTANAIEGDRERCLTAGMDDYLSKPFTLEQLSLILEHWLRQPTGLQSSQAKPAASGLERSAVS